jgi:hypothetical protein
MITIFWDVKPYSLDRTFNGALMPVYALIVSCATHNFLRIFFFYYFICKAIGTAATPGLLCQSRVIVKMIVEKQMECRLAGETEILGENLPQTHFCPS